MSRRALVPFLLVTLLAACGGNDKAAGDTGVATTDGGTTDDGGAVDTGADVVLSAVVTDDITTVLRVSWTTETATSGIIEFGETTAYGHQTAATASGTEHEVLLLGMPAETEVHFRLVDATDATLVGPDNTATTGYLPSSMPTLTGTGAAPSWDGWLIVPINGTIHGVLILDDQGRIVWYHEAESTANVLSAFASPDRQSFVYCQPFGSRDGKNANALRVSMDGSTVEVLEFDQLSHHCVGLPDGTIAAPVPDPLIGETSVSAEQLVELSPDGEISVIWSAWDWLDTLVDDRIEWAEENTKEGSWTHVVSTDYNEETNTYLLSLKDIGTQVCIDRATGEVLWAINGLLGQFTHTDGTEDLTDVVHQMDLNGDQLLLFDNGGQDREGSMIAEYLLDVDLMETELLWSYVPDPLLYNYALGDVRRLDDGATQVVWSVLGQIQDLSPKGEVLWQLDIDLGYAYGFITHHDSLYTAD
jgi:Arylsulfotransferase (ASST)